MNIPEILALALRTIEREHGVRVINVRADWIDVSTHQDSKALLHTVNFDAMCGTVK